jgi:hypothetical protein
MEKCPKKIYKEYTDNGFCKIIFGAGDTDISELNDFVGCRGQIERIGKVVNNLSLGEIPQTNNTLYVRYRVGGGEDSNIGVNTITSLGTTGSNQMVMTDNINKIIKNSITVNNPIPALGGKEEPSVMKLEI